MKNILSMLCLAFLLAGASPRSVQAGMTVKSVGTELALAPEVVAEGEKKAAEAANTLEDAIKGMGFGPGIAAIYMFGDKPVDTAAAGTDGVLRVAYKSRARAGAVLETHFSFGDPRVKRGLHGLDTDYSHAAQAATSAINAAGLQAMASKARPDQAKSILAGSPGILSAKKYTIQTREAGITVMAELGDGVIRSLGVGPMLSARRYDIEVKDAELTITPKGTAFNLSLVGLIEPDVRTLARGFADGQPVPAGTGATIPFDKEPAFGAALVFSASW
jgi:hypothetical protein